MPCGAQEALQSPTCLGQTFTTGLLSNELAQKNTRSVVIMGGPSKTFYPRETPESLDVMVTQTGRPGVVFNGVADWVYEEEVCAAIFTIETDLRRNFQVLSDTRAIWFSPDGDKIAWTQFNDTDVSMRNILLLLSFGNNVVCSDNDEDKTMTQLLLIPNMS